MPLANQKKTKRQEKKPRIEMQIEARIAQHQRLLVEWMAEQHAAAVAAQRLRQQERERELAEQAAAALAGD